MGTPQDQCRKPGQTPSLLDHVRPGTSGCLRGQTSTTQQSREKADNTIELSREVSNERTRTTTVDNTIKNSIKIITQKSRNGLINRVNSTMEEGVTIRIAIRSIPSTYTKDGIMKSKLSKDKTTIKITDSGTGKRRTIQDCTTSRLRRAKRT